MVAGGVVWFHGVLGVWLLRVGVWCVVGCSSCSVSLVGSVLFWFVRCFGGCVASCVVGVCCVCVLVVLLFVLVLVCCVWSAFLLLVVLWLLRCCCGPPGVGWFVLLLVRVLLFWWFLVVVGPPPLFLVRPDLGWLWSCSWFNAECHPVGWLCGVSAPGGYGSLSRCAFM